MIRVELYAPDDHDNPIGMFMLEHYPSYHNGERILLFNRDGSFHQWTVKSVMHIIEGGYKNWNDWIDDNRTDKKQKPADVRIMLVVECSDHPFSVYLEVEADKDMCYADYVDRHTPKITKKK